MPHAFVNRILPSSLVDGPGNRTAIFLQGCNIHCAYCHNPETQHLCYHCGHCVSICPSKALSYQNEHIIWDSTLCTDCASCITTCPHYASPKSEYLSAQDVYTRIQPSFPFIRGITVSGGECTLYPDFLEALFTTLIPHNLNLLIDSNGMIDFSLHHNLIALCDGVMLDVKSWSETISTSLVGCSNNTVKQNIRFLHSIGKLHEIRIVCIEHVVDTTAILEGLYTLLGPTNIKDLLVKLIRFRPYGVRGSFATLPTPSKAYMATLYSHAYSLGFNNVKVI